MNLAIVNVERLVFAAVRSQRTIRLHTLDTMITLLIFILSQMVHFER